MASNTVVNYTFNAISKQITLTDFTNIEVERINLIHNETTGTTIYKITDPLSITVSGNVITHSNTTTMSDTDKLRIEYSVTADDSVKITNSSSIFNDTFNSFDTTNKWEVLSQGSDDLIQIDGNTVGSNYLVMSLDPLADNTQTIIQSKASFNKTDKLLTLSASASQRVVGHELSCSIVSTESPTTNFTPLPILSIQQLTTTLTINTATAHGLRVGDRISISNVPSSRLNYQNLVIATAPSPTSFTCTANAAGNLPSISSSLFSTGFIHYRSALDYIPNGVSLVYEAAAANQFSAFIRNGGDGFYPSGAVGGNHSAACTGIASSQLIADQYNNINFQTSAIQQIELKEDCINFAEKGTDSTTLAQVVRLKRELITPNPALSYKIRLGLKASKSNTRPIAKIISATKTGTTTATIITNAAHGFSTNDFINIYGIRDQTNFPNLTTATQVASIINSTEFTIIIGSASTNTSYGGYVSRVNGGVTQGGAIAQVAQSISRTSNLLTIIGNATWTGLSVGDYVNLYGCMDNSTGADLGLDGSYKVIYFTTTTLVLSPIGSAPTGSDIASTNCGGGIIKRTDFRINKISLRESSKNLVEFYGGRSSIDSGNATSAYIVNTPAVTISSGTITTITAANLNASQLIADQASAAITTTTTSATITPTFGCTYRVSLPITVVSGTTPTLDFVIQESDDSGTNWFDVYHFPRITATGIYRSPKLMLIGNRIRYVQTISGTTPSFTRSINRLQSSDSAPNSIRQIFNRSVSLTTLNSTTSSLNSLNCNSAQLTINIGAATTAPTLQLEGSEDGVTWFSIGGSLLAVASSTVSSTFSNINVALLRAIVSSAGSVVTAGYVLIKSF